MRTEYRKCGCSIHLQPTLLADLKALARDVGHPLESEEFADAMDKADPLRDFRAEFAYPKMKVSFSLSVPCRPSSESEREQWIDTVVNAMESPTNVFSVGAAVYRDEIR